MYKRADNIRSKSLRQIVRFKEKHDAFDHSFTI